MLIKYFAMLRQSAGMSEQVWDAPVSTLRELLEVLCVKYGPGFRKWLEDDEGNLGGLSIIVVNGIDYRHLGGLDMPLKPEDVVAIFPPVAGG
jgi:molybdopterin synthase sulfur carrier subunit